MNWIYVLRNVIWNGKWTHQSETTMITRISTTILYSIVRYLNTIEEAMENSSFLDITSGEVLLISYEPHNTVTINIRLGRRLWNFSSENIFVCIFFLLQSHCIITPLRYSWFFLSCNFHFYIHCRTPLFSYDFSIAVTLLQFL